MVRDECPLTLQSHCQYRRDEKRGSADEKYFLSISRTWWLLAPEVRGARQNKPEDEAVGGAKEGEGGGQASQTMVGRKQNQRGWRSPGQ